MIAFKNVAGDLQNASVEYLSIHLPDRGLGGGPAPKFPLEQNVRLRENRVQPVDPNQPAQIIFTAPHAPGLSRARPLDMARHKLLLRGRRKVVGDAREEWLNPLPHARPCVLRKRRTAFEIHPYAGRRFPVGI